MAQQHQLFKLLNSAHTHVDRHLALRNMNQQASPTKWIVIVIVGRRKVVACAFLGDTLS